MDDGFDTPEFRTLLAGIRAGDPAARDRLIRACQDRLERLTRRMLRGFPNVRRWADTGDVFQNAAMRLLHALSRMDVADTRGLFNLAATMIQRELLDLARHFGGPMGLGANYSSHPAGGAGPAVPDRPAPDADPAKLDEWTALHDAALRLPPAEQEVFGLIFYHGWKHARVAALCGCDLKTVGRRWKSACDMIRRTLDRPPPGGDGKPRGVGP